MASPLLHTRVRDSVEFSQSPEQLLAELEALAGQKYRMAVEIHDADNIEFEIERGASNRPDLIISGIIRRWHGTESRLDFMGEVDVPPAKTWLQQLLVVAIVIVANSITWQIVRMSSDGSQAINLWKMIAIWTLVTIFSGWGGYWLLVRDTHSKLRWKLQQEMAQFVEKIHALRHHPDTSSEIEYALSQSAQSRKSQS